jgi:hypothetical protein
MPDELHSRATHPVSSIGSVLESLFEQLTGPPLVPEPALEPLRAPALVVDPAVVAAPPPTPVPAAFPRVVLAALPALLLPPGSREVVDELQAQLAIAPRSMATERIFFMG